MNKEDALKRLTPFLCRDKGRSLHVPAFSNGSVFTTDGRIGFRVPLDEACENSYPESYPIESLALIISRAEACTKWYAINEEEFGVVEHAFIGLFKSEVDRDIRTYNDRYKEMVCPHCGDTFYLDAWTDELVHQRDERIPVEERDVECWFKFVFGENESMHFSFGYLHMLRRNFGRDILFALDAPEEGKYPHLLFKLPDGQMFGVLMPARTEDEYRCKNVIHAIEEKS